MDTKDKELTAYCGLYCGDCIRYNSKASTLAYDLRAVVSQRFSKKTDKHFKY